MPPSVERFCKVPEAVSEAGYNELCIRMIDNFPWSFDCRMKSDSAYPENVVSFVAEACYEKGIAFSLVFPGLYDYVRLIRLNGYRRLALDGPGVPGINTDAVGFSHLIETITEDMVSLCPQLSCFVFENTDKHGQDYYLKCLKVIESSGVGTRKNTEENEFHVAEFFMTGNDSELGTSFRKLQEVIGDLAGSLYQIRQYIVMSSLGTQFPAASEKGIHFGFEELKMQRKEIFYNCDSFSRAASGLLEPGWLEHYCRTIQLNADDEIFSVERRLRQTGLLK